jgi:hypothetical protein
MYLLTVVLYNILLICNCWTIIVYAESSKIKNNKINEGLLYFYSKYYSEEEK